MDSTKQVQVVIGVITVLTCVIMLAAAGAPWYVVLYAGVMYGLIMFCMCVGNALYWEEFRRPREITHNHYHGDTYEQYINSAQMYSQGVTVERGIETVTSAADGAVRVERRIERVR